MISDGILLSINIPTYKRFNSFSLIIHELEDELNGLPDSLKSRVNIRVYENHSCDALLKKEICDTIRRRSAINLSFVINETNIGADANILQCCCCSLDAYYTWVLGDDDHLVKGSLSKIIDVIVSFDGSLGLIIVNDKYWNKINAKLLSKDIYSSYYSFAHDAVRYQPHFLVAHTLISANIFKSSVFDESEARAYSLHKVRVGLPASFIHMYGMVNGLMLSDENPVIITRFETLDLTKRLPPDEAVNHTLAIYRIYYLYYLWLLLQLGLRIDAVKKDHSMWWLFSEKKPLSFLFISFVNRILAFMSVVKKRVLAQLV